MPEVAALEAVLEADTELDAKHKVRRTVSWRGAKSFVVRSNILLGFVLTVLSWPYNAVALRPQVGIDAGWSAALEMVAQQRLPFGTHVAFAYGPLGFLSVWAFYFTATAILSFVFFLVLYTAIFASLIWSLRRAVPLVVALVVAFVAGTMSINVVALLYTGEPEKALALALIGSVYALTRGGAPVSRRLWVAFGVGIGIITLVKISVGVGVAVVVVITIACLPAQRRRAAGSVVVTSLATLAVGWFVTGNGLGNIGAFARGTAAIVGGYSSAESLEDPSRLYTYWVAALIVVMVAGLAVARSWRLPRRAQIGTGLATAVVVWQLFKEGFIRHDSYHDPVFFAAAPLLLAAFVMPKRTWSWGAVAVAGVLSTSVIAGLVTSFPTELTRPGTGAASFANEVATLASSSKRSAQFQSSRAQLQGEYDVPIPMLAQMEGHTVDVDPWEQQIAWAYPGLKFDPLPGLQAYSTYTTSLDQLDANFLASSDAPTYIVREPPSTPNGHDPTFAPPATQIAIECHYRQVAFDLSWQLVERMANRCGTLQPLGSVSTGLGEFIPVPTSRSGDAVVATIQLPLSLWWQLQDEAFKPPTVYMSVNGGATVYRFEPGTESSLHLLQPASTLDYAPEFTPQDITNFAFTIGGEGYGTPGVVVRFYALPMAAGASLAQR